MEEGSKNSNFVNCYEIIKLTKVHATITMIAFYYQQVNPDLINYENLWFDYSEKAHNDSALVSVSFMLPQTWGNCAIR